MASSPDEIHLHHSKKKRVGKACDLCRIKKTKCDGKKPCSRCIADNKLCAFTDKKRHKEKNHPTGYIDLLETRLDLVTKSLETIVLMAAPHLPFLQQLMNAARADHASISSPESESLEPRAENYVPINEVVSYLITDMGLLDKEPLGWERGARIAAKLSPLNMDVAAREFTQHKLETARAAAAGAEAHPSPAAARHSRNNSSDSGDSPARDAPGSITEQLNLDDISLGGFSDPLHGLAQSQLLDAFPLDGFPKRANSLFLNNRDLGTLLLPVSSLANHLETYGLDEATRTRRLLSLKGPLSPSHQKAKLTGHVHKLGFLSHIHHAGPSAANGSSTNNNYVSNNGNEFHLPKGFASTQSLPGFDSAGLSKNLVFSQQVVDDDLVYDNLLSNLDMPDFKPTLVTEKDDIFTNNPFWNF